jgi:hypothetical protein
MVCRSLKFPTTAEVGITHCILPAVETQITSAPIAANAMGPGPKQITGYARKVQVFGNNPNTKMALLGKAAANAIVSFKDASGAVAKVTLKSVQFIRDMSQIEIQRIDFGGQVPAWGLEGECEWGSSDTPATMEIWATDT